jgi:hypothetical protein
MTATISKAPQRRAGAPPVTLAVCTRLSEQRMLFASREAALDALAAIEAKIGRPFANDPDILRHRVEGIEGAAVFSMAEVVSARVIDSMAWHEATSPLRAVEDAQAEKASKRQAEILAQAISAALARLPQAGENMP